MYHYKKNKIFICNYLSISKIYFPQLWMTNSRKNPPFGITTHNECHPRYQSFITASSNDLGCFTSDTGDLCAGTDLRQLAHPCIISMQISIGSKEHTWMAGGCLFSRSASQPLVANSKTERGFHGSAGMKVAIDEACAHARRPISTRRERRRLVLSFDEVRRACT